MNIRPANKRDYELINELCELSFHTPAHWIGYPRVENLDVLKAEVNEYNNTIEHCVRVIEDQLEPIGMTGYLHEAGDDEAYIIGPVFKERYHTITNVKNLLTKLQTESPFKRLRLTTPTNNAVTNTAISELGWRQTSQQLEMVYQLEPKQKNNKHSDAKPIQDHVIPGVAKLFEDTFKWDDAHKQLTYYLDEFGMDAAYISEGEKLKGAILWDVVEGTNFIRLEDVAVAEGARRQGIASKLIEHVILEASFLSKEEIFLAVDLDNIKAIKLYEKIGFERNMVNVSHEIKS